MRTAALACRSYYSLLRGAASVQAVVQKAKEYGYDCVAVADVNGMYGVVDFVKAAEKVDIRAIIGVEILTDMQRAVLLAENEHGYKNLCRIITSLNLDESFDLTEQLERNNEGVICISAQMDLLKQLKGILSKDRLFVGLHGDAGGGPTKFAGIRPVAFGNFNIIDKTIKCHRSGAGR
jgi:DNA polymerase III alpha subunit